MDHSYSQVPSEVTGVADSVVPPEAMTRQEAMEGFSNVETSLNKILGAISAFQPGPQAPSGGAGRATGAPQENYAPEAGTSQGNLADHNNSTHPATAPSFLKVASRSLASSLHTEQELLLLVF